MKQALITSFRIVLCEQLTNSSASQFHYFHNSILMIYAPHTHLLAVLFLLVAPETLSKYRFHIRGE